ncbi:hypothetical protein OG218_02195 [Kineococcus sp. NBC_00420]|uniref:hypothetical protein n=1 Tax=unclassified Kineococcus TaxID=2621656 RepID=UPI002E1EAF26
MKPSKLISVRAHDKRVHRAQSALTQARAKDEALRAAYAAGPGRRPTAAERDRAKARLMAFLTDDAAQATTSAAAAPSATQG